MPQGRIILKSICQSKKLAALKSDGARLLYTWLIPNLDINGCFSGDPDVVKGQIFTRLKKSASIIQKHLEDLAGAGLIILYSSNGDMFLQIPDFAEKQPSINPDREAKPTIPLPTHEELRMNSGETPLKVKESKVKESKVKPGDAFEDFWGAYPKKKSKGQARTTWAKLKKAGKLPELAILQDAIAVAETSHDWQRDNGQYILNPSTWLNAEGWKDVIKKGGQPVSSPKCFVCKGPTKSKLHNRSNVYICDCCKRLLDKAPNFTTRQDKTIPKHKLVLSQLEEMILKAKTEDRD